MEPHFRSVFNHIHHKKHTFHLGFTLASQSIPYKAKIDHDKIFDANVEPKSAQKYISHENHSDLGQNGTSQLYEFINRQYYLNSLKKATQDFLFTV